MRQDKTAADSHQPAGRQSALTEGRQVSEHGKNWIDWLAVGTAVSTIAGWLPPIAALMSIIWLGWQMWDRWQRGPR